MSFEQTSTVARHAAELRAWGTYVDGAWKEPTERAPAEVVNPATGEIIAHVPRAGAADVAAAVAAAHRAASGPWGSLPPTARGKLLLRLAGLLQRDAEDFAHLETANVGKPIAESRALDVPAAISCLEYYAGWANKLYGETIPHSLMPVLNYTVHEPVGVVAAMVPWNFPLAIATWKLAPALAMGNTVVLKPASLTPLTALRLAELCEEAEFPAGVVNVVTGSGSEVGDALVEHPLVAKIAFTGSTETGREIMRKAAPTLKKVTLECGGKSPNIVFADANLEVATEATLFGIFSNQGEVCAAGSRLLVEESIHDEFLERLVARAEALRVGDPQRPETQIGALASVGHLERVHSYVESGLESGAELLAGGAPATVEGLDGNFYQPTIFDRVNNRMRIAQEEIFGPVLSTLTFSDEAEALEIANDTEFGLVANVHTESLRRAHRVAARLQCGTVFVNLPPIPFTEAPIGGYKQTGIGKDLGRDALDSYTTKKSVVVGMLEPGQAFRWYRD